MIATDEAVILGPLLYRCDHAAVFFWWKGEGAGHLPERPPETPPPERLRWTAHDPLWRFTRCSNLADYRLYPIDLFAFDCGAMLSLSYSACCIRSRTRGRLLTGIDRTGLVADLPSSFWASFEVLTISSNFRITELSLSSSFFGKLSLSSSFWASFAPNDFFEPKRETRRSDPGATENRRLGRCI